MRALLAQNSELRDREMARQEALVALLSTDYFLAKVEPPETRLSRTVPRAAWTRLIQGLQSSVILRIVIGRVSGIGGISHAHLLS